MASQTHVSLKRNTCRGQMLAKNKQMMYSTTIFHGTKIEAVLLKGISPLFNSAHFCILGDNLGVSAIL